MSPGSSLSSRLSPFASLSFAERLAFADASGCLWNTKGASSQLQMQRAAVCHTLRDRHAAAPAVGMPAAPPEVVSGICQISQMRACNQTVPAALVNSARYGRDLQPTGPPHTR